jgi:voltage-gated potassium channel
MIERFFHYLFRVVWHLRSLYLAQLVLLIAGAAAISVLEKIPFGEAVYFAFITGLTIGYGDIVAHTALGRIVCVALGFIRIIFSGLVVASATLAVRQSWEEIHGHE